MEWNDVRHFLALARTGSVRAAGSALSVSHSTVSRRVEALEEQLATRLFDRNRDGFHLTEAGERMLPGAERIEAEMLAMERALHGQDERLEGTVTLTCCDHYVSELLMPELLALCTQSPALDLHINVDTRSYDLAKREADVAVRILVKGDQPPEYLIGRTVAPLVIANYVAVDHIATRSPDSPGSTPIWAGFDPPNAQAQFIAESSYPDVPLGHTFASIALMCQAAHAGFGIIMLPTYVGDALPSLKRLDKPDLRHAADIWVLTHPDLRDNARFRATKRAVLRAFETHQDLFAGASVHPAVS